MIRQRIILPKYGWIIKAWYAVDDCYTEEIVSELDHLGAKESFIEEADKMLRGGMLNQGLTYVDPFMKEAAIVVGITTSAEEFHNTYEHEKRHLVEFIAEAEGIPAKGEEISYLDGYIAGRMFSACKSLMCDCCRKKR